MPQVKKPLIIGIIHHPDSRHFKVVKCLVEEKLPIRGKLGVEIEPGIVKIHKVLLNNPERVKEITGKKFPHCARVIKRLGWFDAIEIAQKRGVKVFSLERKDPADKQTEIEEKYVKAIKKKNTEEAERLEKQFQLFAFARSCRMLDRISQKKIDISIVGTGHALDIQKLSKKIQVLFAENILDGRKLERWVIKESVRRYKLWKQQGLREN